MTLDTPGQAPGLAPARPTFYGLDALRGVAALAIVERHVAEMLTGPVLPSSYLAVDFFFVLSGFVLAHAYGARLAGGLSAGGFLAARLVRLYPLYLLALLLGAGFLCFKLLVLDGWDALPLRVPISFGLGLLFLPVPPTLATDEQFVFPLNGPAWSLFFELAVNFVYGAVALRLTNRALWAAVGASALALGAASFAVGSLDAGWGWSTLPVGAARVLFSFFAGVLAYRLWPRRPRRPAVPLWALALALAATLACPVPEPLRPAYDLLAAVVVLPAIVVFAAGTRPTGAVKSAAVVLGAVSYPLYVLHVPLITAFADLWAYVSGDGLPPSWALVAFVPATVALSWALDRWYDRPVRRVLGRRFLGPRRRAVAAAPPF